MRRRQGGAHDVPACRASQWVCYFECRADEKSCVADAKCGREATRGEAGKGGSHGCQRGPWELVEAETEEASRCGPGEQPTAGQEVQGQWKPRCRIRRKMGRSLRGKVGMSCRRLQARGVEERGACSDAAEQPGIGQNVVGDSSVGQRGPRSATQQPVHAAIGSAARDNESPPQGAAGSSSARGLRLLHVWLPHPHIEQHWKHEHDSHVEPGDGGGAERRRRDWPT